MTRRDSGTHGPQISLRKMSTFNYLQKLFLFLFRGRRVRRDGVQEFYVVFGDYRGERRSGEVVRVGERGVRGRVHGFSKGLWESRPPASRSPYADDPDPFYLSTESTFRWTGCQEGPIGWTRHVRWGSTCPVDTGPLDVPDSGPVPYEGSRFSGAGEGEEGKDISGVPNPQVHHPGPRLSDGPDKDVSESCASSYSVGLPRVTKAVGRRRTGTGLRRLLGISPDRPKPPSSRAG